MKLALFSVSYAGLWGQEKLSLEAFIPKARALGYDGVMLMAKRPHAFPSDLNEARRSEIRKLLKSSKLQAVCIGAYTNFTAGLESREVPLNDLQIEYVGECAKLAKELECDAVRIFTGYEVPGVPIAQLWSSCVQAVRACCESAARHGVKICVQNHHDVAVHTDALLEFVNEVGQPNCVTSFDAWSPCLRGEDLAGAARKMASRTHQTIVADYVRLPRSRYRPELVNYENIPADLIRAVPMGEGFIDYKGFMAELSAGGFGGWTIYETCSPLRGGGGMENLDACTRRFVQYMREMQ